MNLLSKVWQVLVIGAGAGMLNGCGSEERGQIASALFATKEPASGIKSATAEEGRTETPAAAVDASGTRPPQGTGA